MGSPDCHKILCTWGQLPTGQPTANTKNNSKREQVKITDLLAGLALREPGLLQGAASSLPWFVSGWGGRNPGASLPDSSVTTTPGESRVLLGFATKGMKLKFGFLGFLIFRRTLEILQLR